MDCNNEKEYNYLADYQEPLAMGVIDMYPSWCLDNGASVTSQEINQVFVDLGYIFGFQNDNVENMFEHFMIQLDSRSSRTSCPQALLSLHGDYIGGEHSNFKKWYFAAQYDLDQNISKYSKKKRFQKLTKHKTNVPYSLDDLNDLESVLAMEYQWRAKMNAYSDIEYIRHIALYLLVWGEANNVRFMPECLCFFYQCMLDYLENGLKSQFQGQFQLRDQFYFLDSLITPVYSFIRDQQFDLVDGVWRRNKKDHNSIIGYDDVNQFFWYPEGLRKIKLTDGRLLLDLPREERYDSLKYVNWKKSFYKTYKEKRTWMHAFTNFSRVWIIHITMFWYYNCFNSPSLYTKNYHQLLDNKPAPQVQWSLVSLGGFISCLIAITATVTEWRYVPRKWPGAEHLSGRLCLLTLLAMLNAGPSVYILGFIPIDAFSKLGIILGSVQFIISIFTFLYLAITPPNLLFRPLLKQNANAIRTQAFMSAFPHLKLRSQLFSYLLWVCVFLAKFFESYFFLTLSLRDPVRVLSHMLMSRCYGDSILRNYLCKYQPQFTLVIIFITNLILFFLDTYLWYVVCNCIFSVGLSFASGISIFTPWRNIFSRLPERIASKIIGERNQDSIQLISQVWNSIILSMFREHLLSIDQVNKLIFQQDYDSKPRPPLFFVYQDDNSFNLNDFFTPGKDSERRISFFAQSLSSTLPEPIPTKSMPSFTVIIPHFSEEIVLNLKDIIKEVKGSKVSLLDYLKNLHLADWDCFVKDTKILQLAQSADIEEIKEDAKDIIKDQINDLPYYCVGFKDSSPEYTLRTRLWASLRSQTLYRTISGFQNYETAIKLLYRVENEDQDSKLYSDPMLIDKELNEFVRRKFRLLISMQRFQSFSEEEKLNADFLFKVYPNLQVAYLENVETNGKTEYYSTLLDVSRKDLNGDYLKKFRIKLSGNPILGDGKSDNQNHALIFHRGEYIQVIDANQDNYLEECLKIKSVLAEFEEIHIDASSQYIPGTFEDTKDPVAILGAREYIFSESIGVLGDIAAGKEQTFGTLFARTLAEIGGKLHYGHPDFLNGIFMTTRGGISKAQKGLHLNEDIYAGITALCRGGRIKHCDYYQCGKGRDLGFSTILNFTTKIGAGMGEQILSREYYYLGTQLPIDRFLSFYYAHAGFHINNLFIMLSVHLCMLVLVNLGSLANESIICMYDSNVPFTDLEQPLGCYNLRPALNWVTRFVFSVFICFFISFIPLVIQEIIEKGVIKALRRIFNHFVSMAPVFEVFVCQVYAQALQDNIIFGGARYISTGRGFATSRMSFNFLYSKYAMMSIYPGSMVFLIILFATSTMWQPSLLWFWITVVSLCLAPFIFNPHQFSWCKFFLDYREYLRWLSRGNTLHHHNSWIGFVKQNRARFTGFKSSKDANNQSSRRPARFNGIVNQVFLSFVTTLCLFVPYMFINAQNGVSKPYRVSPLFRFVLVSMAPILLNSLMLFVLFIISSILAPLLGLMCYKVPSVLAGIAHFFSLLFMIITFQVIMFFEGYSFSRSLCCLICTLSFHRTLAQFVEAICLSRELKDDSPNRAWWSGKWLTSGIGWLVITQPIREFLVKLCECHQFAYDFVLGHFLLMAMSPILFIPFIDKWHSSMLFWVQKPSQFRDPIYSQKQKRNRTIQVVKYSILFFVVSGFLILLVMGPIVAKKYIPDIQGLLPMVSQLIQPRYQNNNDTGENAPSYIPRETPERITMRTVR